MMRATYIRLILVLYLHSVIAEVYIQLKDGLIGANEGRVRIFQGQSRQSDTSTEWGLICNDGFHGNTSQVICSQLQYSYGAYNKHVLFGDASIKEGFLLKYINCVGNETSIDECVRQDSIKQTTCNARAPEQAGVCCSNNSDFGEWHNGKFRGDCSLPWSSAQTQCQGHGVSLLEAPPTEVLSNVSGAVGDTPVWIGKYYSRWIWAMGCYKLSEDETLQLIREKEMDYITPAICSEFCYQKSNSREYFGIRGNTCLCLNEKDGLQRTISNCCLRTPMSKMSTKTRKVNRHRRYSRGRQESVCPSQDRVLRLYRTALSSDLAMHRTPTDVLQCATIKISAGNRPEMTSANCNEKYSFICQTVHLNGSSEFIVHSKASYTTASDICGLQNASLATNDILSHEYTDEQHGIFWIDITRHVISASVLPKLSGNEGICVAMTTTSTAYMYMDCKKAQPFVCSPRVKNETTHDALRPNTTRQTILATSQRTPNSDVTLTSSDSPRNAVDHPDETEIIIICIAVGLALTFLLIVLSCLCFKGRYWKDEPPIDASSCDNNKHSATMATDVNLEESVIDSEAADIDANNTYETIPADHDDPNSDVPSKPKLEMKTSYSSPLDALRHSFTRRANRKASLKASKSTASYVYPYDSLDLKGIKETAQTDYFSICDTDNQHTEEDEETNL